MMPSQTVEYALRAAVCLAATDQRLTTEELAEAADMPKGYLPKVMTALSRAGLVTAQRGLGGGYRLSRPAETITALEVIEAVEPFRRLPHCPLDATGRRTTLCPLHRLLDGAVALLQQHFGAVTLEQLRAEAAVRASGCGFPRTALEATVAR